MMNEPKLCANQESSSAKCELSEKEARLLQYLENQSSVPIEEFSENVEEVHGLIAAGLAKLEILQRPWGVEFSLMACAASFNSSRGRNESGITRDTEIPEMEARVESGMLV